MCGLNQYLLKNIFTKIKYLKDESIINYLVIGESYKSLKIIFSSPKSLMSFFKVEYGRGFKR